VDLAGSGDGPVVGSCQCLQFLLKARIIFDYLSNC
jgi:hypothetical protein